MSQNTKALRIRIKSVTSTKQLTKAMGLVASSKIRRANDAMLKGRDYGAALENMISALSADRESLKSPYMKQRDSGRSLQSIGGHIAAIVGQQIFVFAQILKHLLEAEIAFILGRIVVALFAENAKGNHGEGADDG